MVQEAWTGKQATGKQTSGKQTTGKQTTGLKKSPSVAPEPVGGTEEKANPKVGVCHKEPNIAVLGTCSSTYGAAAQQKRASTDSLAVPDGAVMLFPPTTLPALVVSSWFVPKVKRPWKGVPTFFISLVIQCGLIAYLIFSVHDRWDQVSACNTAAFAQLCSVFVFATTMFNHQSHLTELQVCLYSTVVQKDGYTEPDGRGLVRWVPEERTPVRATSPRRRILLALVPLTSLFVNAWVFAAGCLFLVESSSVAELIVNTVAVNFISEIDDLMLASFFNKASQQRLAKYRFDFRYGIADGDTQLRKLTPAMRRFNTLNTAAPLVLLGLTALVVAAAQVHAVARRDDDDDDGTRACSFL